MIVITSLNITPKYVCAGDTFNLIVKDGLNHQVIIREEITQDKVIDYIASFRFALKDGTCPGFHLMGIFANSKELPKEMRKAIMWTDLPEEVKKRFVESVGVKL